MTYRSQRRRGSVLPLVAVSLIALIGFVALAIDLGIIMVARNQCQDAADAAAIAGARMFTGDSSTDFNKSAAEPQARKVALQNTVLTQPIVDSEVTINVGKYRYDSTADKFIIDPDGTGGTSSDGWSLVRATVRHQGTSFFATVFNLLPFQGQGGTSGNPGVPARMFDVGAIATAAHRPRDVAVVMDLSGSMRLASLLGGPPTDSSGNLTSRTRSMNDETVYPTFGSYSAGLSSWRGNSTVTTQQNYAGETIDVSNIVLANGNGPAIIDYFFQDNTAFGSSTPAFTSRPDSYASTPLGLKPPYKSGSGSVFAKNVNEVVGRTVTSSTSTVSSAAPFIDTTSPSNTSAGYGSGFASYTVGPRYWGKTFFMWPPDPRGPTSVDTYSVSANNGSKDWRQRFFTKVYLGTRTTTSTSTSSSSSSGSGSGSSSSSGSGSGSGSGSTGSTGGGPPPPPFDVRDPKFSVPLPEEPARPQGQEKAFYFATGVTTNSWTVGACSPMDINAIMWNGQTDLSDQAANYTTGGDGGNGDFKTPGTVTSFKVDEDASTSGGTTTTTRKYHDFTYRVNYDAILAWLRNSGGQDGANPFPTRLRAGGILYYNSIPTSLNSLVYNSNPVHSSGSSPTFPIPTTTQAGKDARFWKEFIDEILGIQQSGWGSWTNGSTTVRFPVYSDRSARMGYKDWWGWGTTSEQKVRGPTKGNLSGISPAPEATYFSNDDRYMDYRDNPRRQSCQFWFGPMFMVDFLGNINNGRWWLPGTIPEAPMWQAKAGVQAAIYDIKANHPNDLVSLVAFSRPSGYSVDTSGNSYYNPGNYNTVRSPLGRDYNKMINSMYFSDKALQTSTEITLYSTDMNYVPRSIGGTCYAMGLMLAYNQFSRGAADTDLRTWAASPAPTGQNGGLGRKGAQKMVIFETDGVVSSSAYEPGDMDAVFANNGAYKSYYKIRWDNNDTTKQEELPYLVGDASAGAAQAIEVATRICSSDTSASAPGFSSTRKPVRIHCIAFGSLFDPANTGGATQRAAALATLQQLQYVGGVQTDPATALEADKQIYGGTSSGRIDKIRNAFSKIMQDGYSMTLIE